MRHLGLTFVFLSSLALVRCASTDPNDLLGAASNAIAYGSQDTTHTAVVAVLGSISGGFTECSGTIVQVKGGVGYVLTAAHCCNMGSPDVVVVSDDFSAAAAALVQGTPPAPPSYAVTAGSTYYDSLYDPTAASPDHDFCMLTFAAPAGMAVIPVAQPGQDGLALGTEVEHVGFGVTDSSTTNTGRRTATAPVDEQLTATILESSQGGPGDIPGTCEGDSGGPALTPASAAQGQQMVVGTTSYGNSQTCAASTAGVCSRVSSETGPGGFITNFLNDAPSGKAAVPSCDTCATAAESGACQTQVTTCVDDPSCNALDMCLGNCTTQACATSCDTTAGTTATAEFNAVNTCISSACPQCATPTTENVTGSGSSGGGASSSHCSMGAAPEPGPLAPLAGLLLGAALTFSRRKRSDTTP
jgi:Trypsin